MNPTEQTNRHISLNSRPPGVPVPEFWAGKIAKVEAAQLAVVSRDNCNRSAPRGACWQSVKFTVGEWVGGQR